MTRTGLRIRGARGHPELRAALIRFAKWVRANYDFPIRVPVYLSPKTTIITIHGEEASASCFAPFDRNEEPYIRIATGDFEELRREQGRDDCLATFIISMSHELIHYEQWLATGEMSEEGVNRKARAMLDRYAKTVDHP